MRSLFSNPPLSENSKIDEEFSAFVGNAAFSSSHGTSAIDKAGSFELCSNNLGIVQIPLKVVREIINVNRLTVSNHSWKELELRLCEARAFLGVLEKQLFQLELSVPGISKELAVLRDEVAQIGYVIADAQEEVKFVAKGNRNVTAELAKAYKRFPELLSKDGNESGSYDDEKPGNSISHNVNPVEPRPVKPCQEIQHGEKDNQ